MSRFRGNTPPSIVILRSNSLQRRRIGCAIATTVLLSLLLYLYVSVRTIFRGLSCHGQVIQLALVVQMYAQDSDARLPPAGTWMDRCYPYVKNWNIFRCPQVVASDPDGYGYAINSDLIGRPLGKVARPDLTPLVFDSTPIQKNATVSFLQGVATPPRHEGTNVIGYLDGRVASTRAR